MLSGIPCGMMMTPVQGCAAAIVLCRARDPLAAIRQAEELRCCEGTLGGNQNA
jgi:hypothetical protein